MKALVIKPPWVYKIVTGEKIIETRYWRTNYRGPLVICASKNPPSPLGGKAVAVAELVDCRPMVKADEEAAGCPFRDGLYAWVLEKIAPIRAVDVRGMPGLFDVEIAIEHEEVKP